MIFLTIYFIERKGAQENENFIKEAIKFIFNLNKFPISKITFLLLLGTSNNYLKQQMKLLG